VFESRKKNMIEQKKIKKEREDESWKLLEEKEAAFKKDIQIINAEQTECMEKINETNIKASCYNRYKYIAALHSFSS
jgi:hypothetical protein